jgi:AcrR family transcriptional regulator
MSRREPDRTREALVEAASREILRNGYRGASLDAILVKAGVTKGALYHHFTSKKELGYAVVDETIRGWFQRTWVEPLRATSDPVRGVAAVLRSVARAQPDAAWELGCPLNNLAQEMSALDEGFRTRLQSVFRSWWSAVGECLRRGQASGAIRRDVNPAEVATFLIATVQGAAGLSKNARDPEPFRQTCRHLVAYLEGLRPLSVRTA